MENTKQKKSLDDILEIVIVILLGITALLTAWASWIGSLHGGEQATAYTTSNNLAAEGNSEYNAGVQKMNQDMILWNDISDMQLEISFAQQEGDELEVSKISYQLFYKLDENLSERMAEHIGWDYVLTAEQYADPEGTISAWLEKEEAYKSPFFDDEYVAGYFENANALLTQSQETLEVGKTANSNGDAFGLVTVIYSIVLFLLGIVGTFKNSVNKTILVAVSAVAFLFATIYMFSLPMPVEFDFMSFFG